MADLCDRIVFLYTSHCIVTLHTCVVTLHTVGVVGRLGSGLGLKPV